MKTCIRCGETKELTEFYKQVRNRDGLHHYCRTCCIAYTSEYNKNNPEKRMLCAAKHRAKKKHLDFTITVEDIVIPEFCPLLGIKLVNCHGQNLGVGKGFLVQDGAPSLDRIDNSKGYTPDNIWVVSFKANKIMNVATYQEILMVGENFKKKVESMNKKQLDMFD